MTTLTITRGLPGSGKTTWARSTVMRRVNRDDLRLMLHGGFRQTREIDGGEQEVTAAQFAAAERLLEYGVPVVIDDTNLPMTVVLRWCTFARARGYRLRIADFTGVPLNVCVARDTARPEPVGEEVIRRMDAVLRSQRPFTPYLLQQMQIMDMSAWSPDAGSPQ